PTDGVYILRGIMYPGDTRGQAWYIDMMSEARGAADLYTRSSLQIRSAMWGIIFLFTVFSACSAWAYGFTGQLGGYTMVASPGALST
ncbi:hypothetical protein FGG77_24810, partial [Escherichia coli]